MSKEAVLNKIKDVGIVAVIRAESVEQAAKITDACVAGGVTTVELCFTVPNADQLISQMVKKYEGTDVTIGAGTVLDPATARIAILNGASILCRPTLIRRSSLCATFMMCRLWQVWVRRPRPLPLCAAVPVC